MILLHYFLSGLFTIWEFLQSNWEGSIAITAIAFTAIQTYYSHKHNRLSVRPDLSTVSHENKSNGNCLFRFFIVNNGLGPAILEEFTVFFGDEIVGTNNISFIKKGLHKIIYDNFGVGSYAHAFTKSFSIPQNANIELLSFCIAFKNDDDYKKKKEIVDKFRLFVRYKSMYGEKYSYDSAHYL